MIPLMRDDEVEVFRREAELTTPLRAAERRSKPQSTFKIASLHPSLFLRMLLAMPDGKIERSADASKDATSFPATLLSSSKIRASPPKIGKRVNKTVKRLTWQNYAQWRNDFRFQIADRKSEIEKSKILSEGSHVWHYWLCRRA